MEPIDHLDLRLFDLNLMVAFDALMKERSVTKAAARMRVGQPAMSHSLAALRMLLRDELLVRVGNVMVPTRHAQIVHERVSEGLMTLQGAMRLSESFDPGQEERTYRLGFGSDVEFTLMPALVALLRQRAPGIRVVGHLVDARETEHLLDEAKLDVAIGCFTPSGSRFRVRRLRNQQLVCLWNPLLLDLQQPLTREDYLSAAHVVVTLDDNLLGCIKAAVARTGEALNVVAASAQFLGVLSIAAAAPVVATLPSTIAALHAERFGLTVAPPPLDLRLPPISMLWSVRTDLDPGAAWLREQIADCLERPEIAQARPE